MIDTVPVDAVHVGNRYRALSEETVAALAKSMEEIGLQTPISVWGEDTPHLVAGFHRLEAARRLGWEHIAVFHVDMDECEREMWEISENLHRADLTKEERDRHIRRYAELLEEHRAIVAQNAEQPRKVGRPKSVTTEIAEMTGLSDDTVRRALDDKPKKPPKVYTEDELDHRDFEKLAKLWDVARPGAQVLFLDYIR